MTMRTRMMALAIAAAILPLGALAAAQGGGDRPQGQGQYELHCAGCHASGWDRPGTVALATRYQGEVPGELVKRDDLVPEYVTLVVRTGLGSMPPFRRTEMNDEELDALAQWLSAQGRQDSKQDSQ